MANFNAINGVGQVPPVGPPTVANKTETSPGFGNMFKEALADVNQKHLDADQAVADLVAGRSQDIHNVMIAGQKADTGFQLLMQVRNKVIGAYETIMRMQI